MAGEADSRGDYRSWWWMMATDEMHSAEVGGQEEWRMHGAQKERKKRKRWRETLRSAKLTREIGCSIFWDSPSHDFKFSGGSKAGPSRFLSRSFTKHYARQVSSAMLDRDNELFSAGKPTEIPYWTHCRILIRTPCSPLTMEWYQDLIPFFFGGASKKSKAA